MGCVSGVAFSSSLYILIDLSHSPVMYLNMYDYRGVPHLTLIEGAAEYTILSWNGTRLRHSLNLLEVVSRLPIPEAQRPYYYCVGWSFTIVCPTDSHIIFVECDGVHDGIVSGHVSQEDSLWTLPDLDVVGSSWSKCVLIGVNGQSTYRFLMVGESRDAPPTYYVPSTDHRVLWTTYDLGFESEDNYWCYDTLAIRVHPLYQCAPQIHGFTYAYEYPTTSQRNHVPPLL